MNTKQALIIIGIVAVIGALLSFSSSSKLSSKDSAAIPTQTTSGTVLKTTDGRLDIIPTETAKVTDYSAANTVGGLVVEWDDSAELPPYTTEPIETAGGADIQLPEGAAQ